MITGTMIKKAAPTIFSIVSAAGTPITAVLSSIATLNAFKRLNSKQISYTNKKEVIKETWDLYIVPAAVCLLTVGSTYMLKRSMVKQIAAITSLAVAGEKTLSLYKEKINEIVGDKTAKKIDNAVTEARLNNVPCIANTAIKTGDGDNLFFDELSGRYFYSDVNVLKAHENKFNKRLLIEYQIPVNEWFSEIGLPPVSLGDELFFDVDNQLDMDFYAKKVNNRDDVQPCLAIQYVYLPRIKI